MKKNYRFMLFCTFLLLGILVAVQFRSTMSRNQQNSTTKYHADQIKAMLNEEKDSINRLKAAIAENEKVMDEYRKNAVESADDEYVKWQHKYLNEIKLKAGLTDVKGPGLTIKLDDATARKNYPSKLLIIHDRDIKLIINELKKAGAQAISINDERLVASSEQICAGPTIMINKARYPVPYTIKAIGNQDALYKAVDEFGWVSLMRRDGIRITIEKTKEMKIGKYNQKLDNLIEGLEAVEK